MRRNWSKLTALVLAGFVVSMQIEPVAAFDAYWFTQRGKNLRAGSNDDEPNLRNPPRQRAQPGADGCGGGGQTGDPNTQPRRGEGCR